MKHFIIDIILTPIDYLFNKIAKRNKISFLPAKIPTHEEHRLVIGGGEYAIRHQIPDTVIFNTGSGTITIGENTVLGEYVQLLTGYHLNVEDAKRMGVKLHTVPDEFREINIGANCYIGSSAIILGNVNIGDYSVIAAGSVVYNDVPSMTIVAGNPAIHIRKLKT
jgi:acetyltransferase-like isoleucine patch superfamily enzyme